MSSVCQGISVAEPITLNKPKHGTTSLMPDSQFTNHESLPPLKHAFSKFIAINPQYNDTEQVDHIREHDYCHLANHICFNYTGFGLFSHSQLSSPFFSICSKTITLKSQMRYGNQETTFESAVKRRIMDFLKISEKEYAMVCTANKTSAFKILGESYPFHSNKSLITVYDHESEAVISMVESAKKNGARVTSAEFCWPSMKIHSEKLKKTVVSKRKKDRGLFVFPPQSQMSGARYPCQWMSLAQENGWHVVLDACSLGPKDMGTLGLSLIEPEFIMFSFFKVFGENPSGFAGLFIKRSSSAILTMSTEAKSIGIISIIPPKVVSSFPDDIFGTNFETQPSNNEKELYDLMNNEERLGQQSSRIMRLQKPEHNLGIECRCLDHADDVGLFLISSRLSCLIDWLANALMKLKHPPHTENARPLVRIYGPQTKLNRGSSMAINLFDWKGEKVEPALVQKLADRSNISVSCGFLTNIWFSDKNKEDKGILMGAGLYQTATIDGREKIPLGISVVNVSLNFLNSFEDAYRLWSFIAKFRAADFIEKERWRYVSLNQTVVEV